MGKVTVRVDAEGRLVLPEEFRISLGLEQGGELILEIENHQLRGMTRLAGLRAAQAAAKPWQPGEPLASEEFIAERRATAKKEAERWG
jgi:bifunctional DNA-binding transcriptional regulator/antitoxin component of YhaV-PrlF toxin-antitoxin module